MNSVIFGKDSVFLHELSGKMKIYVFLMRNSSWNNSTFVEIFYNVSVESRWNINKEYPLSCFGIAFALKWEIGLN